MVWYPHLCKNLKSTGWRTVWRFLKNLEVELPYDPAIPLLSIHTKETRDSNICWITEKATEFQKNICFIDYAKAFDCVDHNKLCKIIQEMGITDHLTCLLRNPYAG